MRFFTLTIRQLSSLSAALAISLLLIFAHSAFKTSWQSLFSDRSSNEIREIREIYFINKVPASLPTLEKVINGASIPAVSLKIENVWKESLFGSQSERISEQLDRVLGDNYPPQPLHGKDIIYFIDLDWSKIADLDDPKIFFHRIFGSWEYFCNSTKYASGGTSDTYLKLPICPPNEGLVRLTFKIQNHYNHRLSSFSLTHGISIRSAEEASWAQRTLPMQHQLPRIIAAIFFLCFALFAVVLAFSMPRYTDLWALAAFCGVMFFVIWVETPFYYEAFQWEAGRSDFYSTLKLGSHGLLSITAACLSLSFFRTKGYYLWLILFMTVGWVAMVLFSDWPYATELPSYKLWAKVDSQLINTLIYSQLIIFVFGFYQLMDTTASFRKRGLTALLPPMKRRMWEAFVFCMAMTTMLTAYLFGMPLQSTTSGPDMFLLFALLPAAVVFVQFYWMMGSSQRFREKLLPQLDYVDYLVLEMRDSHEQTYQGVLAAFDLKGFKRVTKLKQRSSKHVATINKFMDMVQRDISRTIIGQRTVFRYKSNGDEWTWALYAKDPSQAQQHLADLTSAWYAHGAVLLNQWQDFLRENLGPHLDHETADAIAHIDIHVMFCKMDDLTIKTEEGKSRPDYTSDAFTMLSQAFKYSTHTRIAMYEAEASAIIATEQLNATFEPAANAPAHTGYLVFHPSPDPKHITPPRAS